MMHPLVGHDDYINRLRHRTRCRLFNTAQITGIDDAEDCGRAPGADAGTQSHAIRGGSNPAELDDISIVRREWPQYQESVNGFAGADELFGFSPMLTMAGSPYEPAGQGVWEIIRSLTAPTGK